MEGFIQAGGESRGTPERGSNLSSDTCLPALLGTRKRVSSRPFQNDVSTGTSLGFNAACELTFTLRKDRPLVTILVVTSTVLRNRAHVG